MKYLIIAQLIVFVNLFSYSQSIPFEKSILGVSCNSGVLSKDGNDSLGTSYNYTACGLNYVQASNMTTTRYTPTPGTGLPTSLNIAGIPSFATIVQAFVWWGCSSTAADPSFTFNGIEMTGTLIGIGLDKCWSLGGSENYRGDVTSAIVGNGTYTFDSPLGDNAVDGVTLMVIYTDSNATYQSTLQINDGNITNDAGGTTYTTMTGLNVCGNSTFGQAFAIVGDMQDNVSPPSHTATLNGVGTSFPNQFWNFDLDSTIFTLGQTTSNFEMFPNGSGDCYDWMLIGIYYQTTTCVLCTPNSVKENNLANFLLYPNPTTNNISVDLGEIKQSIKATLTNSIGQVVLTQNYSSTAYINLNLNYPKGMYFLMLETEGEVITKKIVKK